MCKSRNYNDSRYDIGDFSIEQDFQFLYGKHLILEAFSVYIESFFTLKVSIPKLNNNRVTKIDVNMFMTIPMLNVTAKPLIGPDPNWERIKVAMSVVMLASRMVRKAFSYPD